jgi:hypothetical protein
MTTTVTMMDARMASTRVSSPSFVLKSDRRARMDGGVAGGMTEGVGGEIVVR